jgi:hypothetical protein
MPVPVRRLALGVLLLGGLAGAVVGSTPVARAQACDSNYGMTPGGCVPGDRDYDCAELHARGIGDIPVIGTDWQRLDSYYNYELGYWESSPNGLGCEWYGE